MWNPDLFVAIKQEYLKPRERKVPVTREAQVAPVKEEIQSKDNDEPAVTSTDSANNNEADANNNQRKRKGEDRSSQAQGGGGKMSLKKRHQKTHPEDKTKRMCSFALRNEKCSFANCKYSHDLIEYLASKDPDIGMICPVYEAYGFCPSGIACRFGDGHIDKVTGINLQRAEKDGGFTEYKEVNYLSKVVQVALRKRKYPNKGKLIVNEKNDSNPRDKVTQPAGNSENPPISVDEEAEVNNDEGKEEVDVTAETTEKAEPAEATKDHEPAVDTAKPVELTTETPFSLDAYPTKEKVKLVDFSNKVYVAPLTTVGNLPFRRILKEYGADITCGEMAMTNNLLGGQASEWALLRRHPCEDVFGIQIAGNHQDLVGKLCNVLEHETQSDFVDLNCGCPIDLVCNAGAGSGLLNRHNRLVDIFKVMAKNLPSRSVTVKVRIGWDEKVPTTHKLIPQLQSAAKGRLAAIFIHGRSRLQRYHKLANWDYVLQCARSQDPTKPLIPIIGNGDILSWEDWKQHQDMIESRFQSTDEDESSLIRLTSCAMIARGALIKPWLANEIKEQRLIDIPATERLDIVKKFCYYGLEHWGSDSQGVETTRRFLLEWLSFLHRYVPVGITEKVQRMNQRPLGFFGRSDLETLLSSSYCEDWIRISEMFLGKVKEDFLFIPKHKTNSYAPESESLLRQYEQAVVDPAASSSTIPEENPALEDGDMLVEG